MLDGAAFAGTTGKRRKSVLKTHAPAADSAEEEKENGNARKRVSFSRRIEVKEFAEQASDCYYSTAQSSSSGSGHSTTSTMRNWSTSSSVCPGFQDSTRTPRPVAVDYHINKLTQSAAEASVCDMDLSLSLTADPSACVAEMSVDAATMALSPLQPRPQIQTFDREEEEDVSMSVDTSAQHCSPPRSNKGTPRQSTAPLEPATVYLTQLSPDSPSSDVMSVEEDTVNESTDGRIVPVFHQQDNCPQMRPGTEGTNVTEVASPQLLQSLILSPPVPPTPSPPPSLCMGSSPIAGHGLDDIATSPKPPPSCPKGLVTQAPPSSPSPVSTSPYLSSTASPPSTCHYSPTSSSGESAASYDRQRKTLFGLSTKRTRPLSAPSLRSSESRVQASSFVSASSSTPSPPTSNHRVKRRRPLALSEQRLLSSETETAPDYHHIAYEYRPALDLFPLESAALDSGGGGGQLSLDQTSRSASRTPLRRTRFPEKTVDDQSFGSLLRRIHAVSSVGVLPALDFVRCKIENALLDAGRQSAITSDELTEFTIFLNDILRVQFTYSVDRNIISKAVDELWPLRLRDSATWPTDSEVFRNKVLLPLLRTKSALILRITEETLSLRLLNHTIVEDNLRWAQFLQDFNAASVVQRIAIVDNTSKLLTKCKAKTTRRARQEVLNIARDSLTTYESIRTVLQAELDRMEFCAEKKQKELEAAIQELQDWDDTMAESKRVFASLDALAQEVRDSRRQVACFNEEATRLVSQRIMLTKEVSAQTAVELPSFEDITYHCTVPIGASRLYAIPPPTRGLKREEREPDSVESPMHLFVPSQLTCTSRAERRYLLRTLLGLIEVSLLCRPLAQLNATDPDRVFLPAELITLQASLRYCQDPHALPAVGQIGVFVQNSLQSAGIQRLLVGKTLEDVQDFFDYSLQPYVVLVSSVRAVWLQGHDISVSFADQDAVSSGLSRSDDILSSSSSSDVDSIISGRVCWRSSSSFYEAATRLADMTPQSPARVSVTLVSKPLLTALRLHFSIVSFCLFQPSSKSPPLPPVVVEDCLQSINVDKVSQALAAVDRGPDYLLRAVRRVWEALDSFVYTDATL
ncbi:hypothetical protein SprV_0602195000 [Sparganum proliferum]